MAAYRMDGGRLFYVEHECQSAEDRSPNPRHVIDNGSITRGTSSGCTISGNSAQSRASVNEFAYMTENVSGEGGTNTYVNCPLCGSEGRIAHRREQTDRDKESFGRLR